MSDEKTSRRSVLGGAAIGLAATAVPAMAQGDGQRSNPSLQNPKDKYTSEPFPEQRQPWPALQKKMNPQPDCGKTSYKGSGRLAGRKALLSVVRTFGADRGVI